MMADTIPSTSNIGKFNLMEICRFLSNVFQNNTEGIKPFCCPQIDAITCEESPSKTISKLCKDRAHQIASLAKFHHA